MEHRVKAFNASTQEEEEAKISIDGNGEFLIEFENGHFMKLPADTKSDELEKALADHQEQSSGQVLIATQEEKLASAVKAGVVSRGRAKKE